MFSLLELAGWEPAYEYTMSHDDHGSPRSSARLVVRNVRNESQLIIWRHDATGEWSFIVGNSGRRHWRIDTATAVATFYDLQSCYPEIVASLKRVQGLKEQPCEAG